jgi:hypothetical protein
MSERLRWKLWGLAARSRRVCPASAVGAIVWRVRPLREIIVDDTCRRDCAENGTCWCGNLRATEGSGNVA